MMKKEKKGGGEMELLFFGGRHRYPGEVVSWGEYFGEWLEHPILGALALFCIIWMFVRMYGAWKMQKPEKEEQWRMEERYGAESAEQKNEKALSYEDTYLDTPPAKRVPDGEKPYQGRYLFVKLSLWVTLFALGFVGVGYGGYKDFMVFLLYAAFVVVMAVLMHLPKDWGQRSDEEKKDWKKAVNWRGVKRFLWPCVLAFAAGIIAKGFLL